MTATNASESGTDDAVVSLFPAAVNVNLIWTLFFSFQQKGSRPLLCDDSEDKEDEDTEDTEPEIKVRGLSTFIKGRQLPPSSRYKLSLPRDDLRLSCNLCGPQNIKPLQRWLYQR